MLKFTLLYEVHCNCISFKHLPVADSSRSSGHGKVINSPGSICFQFSLYWTAITSTSISSIDKLKNSSRVYLKLSQVCWFTSITLQNPWREKHLSNARPGAKTAPHAPVALPPPACSLFLMPPIQRSACAIALTL